MVKIRACLYRQNPKKLKAMKPNTCPAFRAQVIKQKPQISVVLKARHWIKGRSVFDI